MATIRIKHGTRFTFRLSDSAGTFDFPGKDVVKVKIYQKEKLVQTIEESDTSSMTRSAGLMTFLLDSTIAASPDLSKIWNVALVAGQTTLTDYTCHVSYGTTGQDEIHLATFPFEVAPLHLADTSGEVAQTLTFSDATATVTFTLSPSFGLTSADLATVLAAAASEAAPGSGDLFAILDDDGSTIKTVDFDDLPGASAGEANTASSVGGGLSLVNAKSGVDLPFDSFSADQFAASANLISLLLLQQTTAAVNANTAGQGFYRLTASGVTLTILSADIAANALLFVKNESAGNCTLATQGAETVEGLASLPLFPGGGGLFYSDGSNVRQLLASV